MISSAVATIQAQRSTFSCRDHQQTRQMPARSDDHPNLRMSQTPADARGCCSRLFDPPQCVTVVLSRRFSCQFVSLMQAGKPTAGRGVAASHQPHPCYVAAGPTTRKSSWAFYQSPSLPADTPTSSRSSAMVHPSSSLNFFLILSLLKFFSPRCHCPKIPRDETVSILLPWSRSAPQSFLTTLLC